MMTYFPGFSLKSKHPKTGVIKAYGKKCKHTSVFDSQKVCSPAGFANFLEHRHRHCSKKKIKIKIKMTKKMRTQKNPVALIKVIHHFYWYLSCYDCSHSKSNSFLEEVDMTSAFHCMKFHWALCCVSRKVVSVWIIYVLWWLVPDFSNSTSHKPWQRQTCQSHVQHFSAFFGNTSVVILCIWLCCAYLQYVCVFAARFLNAN